MAPAPADQAASRTRPPPEVLARLRCPDPAKLLVFPLYDREARGEDNAQTY